MEATQSTRDISGELSYLLDKLYSLGYKKRIIDENKDNHCREYHNTLLSKNNREKESIKYKINKLYNANT